MKIPPFPLFFAQNLSLNVLIPLPVSQFFGNAWKNLSDLNLWQATFPEKEIIELKSLDKNSIVILQP
ncbi:hypothetical protein [Algoriphagus namhaensis]